MSPTVNLEHFHHTEKNPHTQEQSHSTPSLDGVNPLLALGNHESAFYLY